ncbi:MAG: ribonuclease HII [Aquaticitalea sp.]
MNLHLKLTNHKYECGTDEAGRGCLAGPVTAGAVILPNSFINSLLNDSKLLSAIKRDSLRKVIIDEAITFSFSHIFQDEIDSINILNASIQAMHQAIDQLKILPEYIIVDGNRFKPYNDIPHQTIIKGDGKFVNIAAASIIAKTFRDDYMTQIHEEYPMYNWKQNKGYPTKEHREAIKKYGITKYHRKSFRLLPEQFRIDF